MGRNADTIRAFVDAMNRHDPDAVLACYAADARIIYPGRGPQQPAEYVEGERAMLLAVPDYQIEAASLLEADNQVVLELRMQGTQRPDLGGRHFQITGAYIFHLADGLIVEEHAYPDIAGLRRQLSPR